MESYPPEMILKGGDGKTYACQLLDIIDYDQKEYALLLYRDNGMGDSRQASIVIMRVVQLDGNSTFQTVEIEEEFNRVREYIEASAKEAIIE